MVFVEILIFVMVLVGSIIMIVIFFIYCNGGYDGEKYRKLILEGEMILKNRYV